MSPSMMVTWLTLNDWIRLFPSIAIKDGALAFNRRTALRMARRLALSIFILSISTTEDSPIPTWQQVWRIADKASRSAGLTCLESFIFSSCRARSDCGSMDGMITAAATTGPAKHPRPTSSVPIRVTTVCEESGVSDLDIGLKDAPCSSSRSKLSS